MTEENGNVAEELQQEAAQQEEVVQPQNEESQAPTHEDDKEINFRQLRESKKQTEAELRALRQELEALRRPPQPQEEEDDLGDDDLVEGKHVKKLYRKIEGMLKAKDAETSHDRLRYKFTDFDSVVNAENVEKLKNQEPELYETLTSGKNLYSKGVAVYKTLKGMGIGSADPYARQKQEIQERSKKPASSQSVGSSAIQEAGMFANGLTEELKAQLRREMVQASKAH